MMGQPRIIPQVDVQVPLIVQLEQLRGSTVSLGGHLHQAVLQGLLLVSSYAVFRGNVRCFIGITCDVQSGQVLRV